ncbi:MAG: response regulator [Magnetococcus sp. YQC-5]
MKILIADDELNNRILMREYLTPWGQCDLVVSGEEVVEAFELSASEGQPYDLICLDFYMSGMNGDEALRSIRVLEKEMGIPSQYETFVIMVTGQEESGDASRLYYQGGCTETLIKPITREQLYAKLEANGFVRPQELQATPAPVQIDYQGLDQIPGLDVVGGLERMMGNIELYRELLGDFLLDHGDDVEKVQQALDANVQESAIRILHSIKGTAGNLNAFRVQMAAKELESILRQNRTEYTDNLTEFNAAMREFTFALKNIL